MLSVEGASSSRFGMMRAGDVIAAAPHHVTLEHLTSEESVGAELTHDGYLESRGLIHRRALDLGLDGDWLDGTDELTAPDTVARRRLDERRAAKSGGGALHYAIRFHLHPAVEVMEGQGRVRLILPWAELWQFSFDGPAQLTVEPSLYLEKNRLEPRATKQIVLSGALIGYAARINWRLARLDA